MAPPAKRQRRNILQSSPPASSDHEYDEVEDRSFQGELGNSVSSSFSINNNSPPRPRTTVARAPLTPSKPKPKAKTANHPHNAATMFLPNRVRSTNSSTKSPSTSPEKAKGKGKVPEKGKSGDLVKLFSSQIQKQRTVTTNTGVGYRHAGSQNVVKNEGSESSISDDDDDVGDRRAQDNSIVGAAAKKRAHGTVLGHMDVISSSQKFLLKPSTKPEKSKEEDLRPWAERFAPLNLEELAVHKKKVVDVRGWLESVTEGRVRQRLLVIKGAAGTGKTTTVQLLAKDMDCDVLEWRNPGGSVNSADGFVSMAAQFEEFLERGGKFGQLDMFSEGIMAPSQSVAKCGARTTTTFRRTLPSSASLTYPVSSRTR